MPVLGQPVGKKCLLRRLIEIQVETEPMTTSKFGTGHEAPVEARFRQLIEPLNHLGIGAQLCFEPSGFLLEH